LLSVGRTTVDAMPLSRTEREQFLAEPHIGALAVVEAPDRAPLTLPIWYFYEPGGELWIMTQPASRKARAIEAAGRFSLMVERVTPSIRYVSVEGPVLRTTDGSLELTRRLAARYLPADRVAGYVEYMQSQPTMEYAIYMGPEHWLSSDLGEA
jgi:hypothetical protein